MKLRRRRPAPRLELTPLIDVVFLLLTFFVFSLVLTVRADLLDIELPALGGGGRPASGPSITVVVRGDGRLALNGEPVEAPALVERVRLEREAAPDARLIVASDAGAPAGRLIEVFDRLREAGLGTFAIVGRPEAERQASPNESPNPSPETSPGTESRSGNDPAAGPRLGR